jgi:hypothetical protein
VTEPNIIFILGLPRSGTHLLRFALDKSREVAFVPETAILYKYWGSRTLGRMFGRNFAARIIARSMVTGHGDPTMADFMDREDAIASAATHEPSLSSAALVLSAFFESAPRFVGEKSPNNTLHLRDVLAASDGTNQPLIIFITRDPYDQIASSVRTGHIGGGLITALARHYVYYSAIEGLDLYKVTYETLVKSPEPTLRNICTHLGIHFSTEMLRPGVLDSSEGDNFFQRDDDIGFVSDSIGKGRERLGSEATAKIDTFLASGPSSIPLSSKFQFWFHVVNLSKNRFVARLGIVMFKKMLIAKLRVNQSTDNKRIETN